MYYKEQFGRLDIIDEDGLLKAGEIEILVLGAGNDSAYSRVRTKLFNYRYHAYYLV